MATSNPSPTEEIIPAAAPRGARAWGYFLFLAAGPLAAAAYAAWLTLFTYTHYGPVAAWYRPRLYWLLAAALAAGALWLALRARWRRQTWLRITPTGLTLHLAPHPPASFLWRDLLGVEIRLNRPLLGHLGGVIVLHLRAGSPVRLDRRFPNLPRLAWRLQRALYADRLPAFRQQWASGGNLAFGALQVNRHGLIVRGRTIPWQQISQIGLQNGRLVIELKTDKPLTLPVHRLHNPALLLWWLHDEAQR